MAMACGSRRGARAHLLQRSGLLDPVPPSWAPCLCMPWLAATAWLCYKARRRPLSGGQ